ncbi:ATP-binding protein [Alkalithermobacter paradoxus]|uniref:histidine kinase n=1 Tax=Alkalithermobacter paradoxus TaxID=29349 RepID=A0A1V4I8S7_9FIRM|nr:sporulation kinase E [[Clostridium] thermoalcaliphilum]
MSFASKVCLIGPEEIFGVDLIEEFISNCFKNDGTCIFLGTNRLFHNIDSIHKDKIMYITDANIDTKEAIKHKDKRKIYIIVTSNWILKNIKVLIKQREYIDKLLEDKDINILTYFNIVDFPIDILEKYTKYYDKIIFDDENKRQVIDREELSNIGFLFKSIQKAEMDRRNLENNKKNLQILNDSIISFSFESDIEKVIEKSIKTCLDITNADYGSITIMFGGEKIEKEYSYADIDLTYSYRIYSNNEIVGILTLGYKEKSYKGKEDDYIINFICSSIGDFIYTFRKREDGKKLKDSTNKIKVMGEVAGGIVHDLNNIFAIIKGYTQLLQIVKGASDIKEYINTISDVTNEAIDKIKIIQDFSRNIPEEKKYILINDIIEKAIDTSKLKWQNVGYVSGKDINVILNLNSTKTLLVRENEIKESIINILFNSADSMVDGGNIYINTYDEKEYVVTEIIDEGTGIDEEFLNNIFDPFFTTKEKSTGLGLSIVKKNVEYNGGEITVESIKGEMTKCIIKIPIREEEVI